MPEKRWYVEDHEISIGWSWVIIVAFSFSIAAYGWLVYRLIPEAPRSWDVGQLPDTPAEYIYSTEVPAPSTLPQRQLLKLPESSPGPSAPPAPKPKGSAP